MYENWCQEFPGVFKCLSPTSLCVSTLHLVTWMSISSTFTVVIRWQAMSSSHYLQILLRCCWWLSTSSPCLACYVCCACVAGGCVSVFDAVSVAIVEQVLRVMLIAASCRVVLVVATGLVVLVAASPAWAVTEERFGANIDPPALLLLCAKDTNPRALSVMCLVVIMSQSGLVPFAPCLVSVSEVVLYRGIHSRFVSPVFLSM